MYISTFLCVIKAMWNADQAAASMRKIGSYFRINFFFSGALTLGIESNSYHTRDCLRNIVVKIWSNFYNINAPLKKSLFAQSITIE